MKSSYFGYEMKQRDFAYAEVYRHPPLPVPGLAFDNVDAAIKPGIAPSLATLCKNESNCTVFFEDGMWFTIWGQGSFEGAPDVQSDNILTETDPNKLRFTLLPQGPRGIRVDVHKHRHNPALCRLVKFFNGTAPEDSAYNFQEMTVISLSEGRWLGVGRTFLGSPGYTVTEDRGQTWTSVEPLCYGPEGEPIKHPMTMCPVAKTSDGRIVLLFTNNDGSQRGARHVWDRDGRTRNPQWIVVGREMPGERRNAGIVFGEPMILAGVDDSGETNLKTGISMPQFFERNGRYFVCYNINKEHILLDEIPASVLDKLTPA